MMDVLAIANLFDVPQKAVSFKECKVGHINSTFFIGTESGLRYVLQRINVSIFKDPVGLMNNLVAVTAHIRNKLAAEGKDSDRGTLSFYPLKSGGYCYFADDGSVFRMYRCIEDVETLQLCDSHEVFMSVGRAFGNFQKQLSDFDASSLVETIPDFHNTAKRYQTFLRSLEADVKGRASGIKEDLAFVKEHSHYCSFITEGIEKGLFPLRVTHNDTKLNNLLLDKETHAPVCVIDLDTVMPGSVLYDFGDAIRSGAAKAEEDDPDTSKAGVDLDMFRGFAEGFIEALDGSLTNDEIIAFPIGAFVLTFETGIRFLTDYLDGDVYFRTEYPDHNLVRARNQFAMAADIEKKLSELDAIIRSILLS